MKLSLEFGAFAPSMEQQLGRAGVKANAGLIRHWQKDADAITRLSVRGFLSDADQRRACTRLLKTILRRSSTAARKP